MAHAPSSSKQHVSPQPTGFSQIQGRTLGGGEGGSMSVLLSWHEKVVEVAGLGSVMRVMTDRRTV
jgi:actin related protein 2/3 complex subunit 5